MSLQENIKKKIFVPPLNHSGGGHFGCPPPELLRRGTILRGGTVPPLKLLRGGTVPYSPPLYPLLHTHVHQGLLRGGGLQNCDREPTLMMDCIGHVCARALIKKCALKQPRMFEDQF